MTNRKNMTKLEWLSVVLVVGASLGLAIGGCTDDKLDAVSPAPSPPPPPPAWQVARDGSPETRAVWARFDRIRPDLKTIGSLTDYFTEANGKDPPTMIQVHNKRQWRIRAAPMLSVSGIVEDEDFSMFVPSQTTSVCMAWAEKNLTETVRDEMLTMYFSGVRCYGPGADGGRLLVREWPIP